jgi:succinate dehydrogenase/fumarate reductase flavoprotein subunit
VDLLVAGAGMAGLVAAARARELGAEVVVLEKGDRPGGSMLLSSGVIWRYREWERFRAECPGGDPTLQRVVWERLDEDLAWLATLGASPSVADTGNADTVGARFDPRELTQALAGRAAAVRLREPLTEVPDGVPVVLATGGFQGDRGLVAKHITPEADNVVLRATPWSSGDGLRLALERGAELSRGMNEFYGRNLAAASRITESEFVPLAQVYAKHARVENLVGEPYQAKNWAEVDVVQWTARQPRARARYLVSDDVLDEPVRERTVREVIEAARQAGAPVERRDGETVVEVVAGITATLGGIKVDERARAADGLYAAGVDAGGISTGGWSSALASALVLGKIAAEDAISSLR